MSATRPARPPSSKAHTLTRSVLLLGLALAGCPEEDLSPFLTQGACNSNADCVDGFRCVEQACVKNAPDAGNTCDSDCKHTQCINGTCATSTCEPGFVNCKNGFIVDGCEVEGDACPPDGG